MASQIALGGVSIYTSLTSVDLQQQGHILTMFTGQELDEAQKGGKVEDYCRTGWFL